MIPNEEFVFKAEPAHFPKEKKKTGGFLPVCQIFKSREVHS